MSTGNIKRGEIGVYTSDPDAAKHIMAMVNMALIRRRDMCMNVNVRWVVSDTHMPRLEAERINLGSFFRPSTLRINLGLSREAWQENIDRFLRRWLDITDRTGNDVTLMPWEGPKPRPTLKFTKAQRTRYDDNQLFPASSYIFSCDRSADDEECECLPEPALGSPAIDFVDERERMEQAIKALVLAYVTRYNRMPPLAEIVKQAGAAPLLEAGDLSPVHVNSNLQVILPTFNDVEINLNPLQRTVYIFFLKHPQGIVLKDISDHFQELSEIYSVIKPGASAAEQSIASLCDPIDGTLNVQLARIKRAFRDVFSNEKIVRAYTIGGKRGGVYAIPAVASGDAQVRLPSVFYPMDWD